MISEVFTVSGTPDLDIHIQSGRVEIKPGRPGEVSVDVETRNPEFVVEQRGDQIHIADRSSGWLSSRSSYVVVEAPEGTDMYVESASAKIESRAPLGDAVIKTASGDVDVESAENLDIKTASGDAKVHHVASDTEIKTASGDALINETGGKVNFTSASGDLSIKRGNGNLIASTASGDVEIGHFTGKHANLKSMSGQMEIGVPAGTSLDLDATLLSGQLHTPKRAGGEGSAQRQMAIRAKLVSGDLTIKRV